MILCERNIHLELEGSMSVVLWSWNPKSEGAGFATLRVTYEDGTEQGVRADDYEYVQDRAIPTIAAGFYRWTVEILGVNLWTDWYYFDSDIYCSGGTLYSR